MTGKFPRGWQGPPRAGPPVAWLVVADGVRQHDRAPKASLQAPLLRVRLSAILSLYQHPMTKIQLPLFVALQPWHFI